MLITGEHFLRAIVPEVELCPTTNDVKLNGCSFWKPLIPGVHFLRAIVPEVELCPTTIDVKLNGCSFWKPLIATIIGRLGAAVSEFGRLS